VVVPVPTQLAGNHSSIYAQMERPPNKTRGRQKTVTTNSRTRYTQHEVIPVPTQLAGNLSTTCMDEAVPSLSMSTQVVDPMTDAESNMVATDTATLVAQITGQVLAQLKKDGTAPSVSPKGQLIWLEITCPV
jgi:hypothetical protein